MMAPDTRKSDYFGLHPLKFYLRWFLCKLFRHTVKPLVWLREFDDPNEPRWHMYQCHECRRSRRSNRDHK